MFKPLCICRRLDKLPIGVALHLPTCLRELSLCVDLVGQVHLQKLLLLLLLLKTLLDLIERLLRAEVRLVVERLDLLLYVLDTLLFRNLFADKLAVGTVLFDAVLVFEGLLTVHVVNC